MKIDTRVVRDIFLKYCVVYIDQNAARSHNTNIDNGSLERAEEFK